MLAFDEHYTRARASRREEDPTIWNTKARVSTTKDEIHHIELDDESLVSQKEVGKDHSKSSQTIGLGMFRH
jgi:hypothetical protein